MKVSTALKATPTLALVLGLMGCGAPSLATRLSKGDDPTAQSEYEVLPAQEQSVVREELVQLAMAGKEGAITFLNDPKILEDIAINAPDWDVRKAALEKVNNAEVIHLIVKKETREEVRLLAIEKASDLAMLEKIARNAEEENEIRIAAINKLVDQRVLSQIGFADESFLKPIRKATTARIEALQLAIIDAADTTQEKIHDLAINGISLTVRVAAVKKIDDQETLIKHAKTDEEEEVRLAAVEKVVDLQALLDVALTDKEESIRLAAVKTLTDEPTLAKVAKQTDNEDVGIAAVKKLTQETIVEDVALNAKEWEVRLAALEQVQSPAVIDTIAQQDKDKDVRFAAVKRVNNQDVLSAVAMNSSEKSDIRVEAVKKIANQSRLADVVHLEDGIEWIFRAGSVRDAAFEKLTADNQNLYNAETLEDPNKRNLAKNMLSPEAEHVYNIRNYRKDKLPADRIASIEKLSDDGLLLDVARFVKTRNDSSAEVDDPKVYDALITRIEGLQVQKIKTLTPEDAALAALATDGVTPKVRANVVLKVADKAVVEKMLLNDPSEVVRFAALKRVTKVDTLMKVVQADASAKVRVAAVKRLSKQAQHLATIAQQNDKADVRLEAVKLLKDDAILKSIVYNTNETLPVRLAAVGKITSQAILGEIVKHIEFYYEAKQLRVDAAKHITDQALLIDLLKDEKVDGSNNSDILRALIDQLKGVESFKALIGVKKERAYVVEKAPFDDATRYEYVASVWDSDIYDFVEKAVALTTDQAILAKYATKQYKSSSWWFDEKQKEAVNAVRRRLLEQITDEDLILSVATSGGTFALEFFDKITNEEMLLVIASDTQKQYADSLIIKAVKKVVTPEYAKKHYKACLQRAAKLDTLTFEGLYIKMPFIDYWVIAQVKDCQEANVSVMDGRVTKMQFSFKTFYKLTQLEEDAITKPALFDKNVVNFEKKYGKGKYELNLDSEFLGHSIKSFEKDFLFLVRASSGVLFCTLDKAPETSSKSLEKIKQGMKTVEKTLEGLEKETIEEVIEEKLEEAIEEKLEEAILNSIM